MIKPEIKDYITNLIYTTVAYRESNQIQRFDFLDLLIKIRQNEIILDDDERTISGNEISGKKPSNKNEVGMTFEQMAAEAYLFFGASFDSLSSVIVFCLYELSCNQSIQNRVFLEIEETLNRFDGTICFQALQEMPYLDQVINETMRCYPPFSYLSRVCTKSYKIPESNVTLEEGNRLIIPVYSIHNDPKHYPEPHLFDPERFNPENCKSRHPFVFLPFGEGPRVCIGLRYSLMMVKTAIVTIVNDYAFSLAKDIQVPPQINTRCIVLLPSQPLHLVLTHRRHKPLT
uniref:Cytochrome P450 n=1 Tax=Graphocephala atropunctata TaxID=36148 RepID=A0A1B6KMJ5_9HEMI